MLVTHNIRVDLNQTRQHGSIQPLNLNGKPVSPFSITFTDCDLVISAVVDTSVQSSVYQFAALHTGKAVDPELIKNWSFVNSTYFKINGNGFNLVILEPATPNDFEIEIQFSAFLSATTAATIFNGALLSATNRTSKDLTSELSMTEYGGSTTHSITRLGCSQDFFNRHYGNLCIELNKLPHVETVSYRIQGR